MSCLDCQVSDVNCAAVQVGMSAVQAMMKKTEVSNSSVLMCSVWTPASTVSSCGQISLQLSSPV